MTFLQNLLSDSYLAACAIGLGFLFRMGMCGFDFIMNLLMTHFQKE